MKSILVLLAWFGSAYQDATYDLIWKPRADQRMVYALKLDGKMMESTFQMSAEVHLHVKKVEKNGDYILGSRFKGMVANFDGQSQAVPDEPEELQRFNARGDLLDSPKAEPDDDVISELLSRAGEVQPPLKPVEIGDKWEHAFPADQKFQIAKAMGRYQLLGLESGKLKVSLSYLEEAKVDPTSALGVIYLEAATFTPISIECDVKNLRFQEGVPPGSMKLTMKAK